MRAVKGIDLGNICCNTLKEAGRQLSEKGFFGPLQEASQNFLLGAQGNKEALDVFMVCVCPCVF